MLKNYVKITFRNIVKYKAFSAINISGLAIGMACCLLISLWVLDELSFDRFNENADRIYKVTEIQHYSSFDYKVAVTPAALGPYLKENYPEIMDSARFTYVGTMLLRYKDKNFYENSIVAAEQSFFNIFTYPTVKGDPVAALEDPNGIIINEDIAAKYFGDEDPLGKLIQVNNDKSYTVKCVMKNVPHNSSLRFEIVLPWVHMRSYSWYSDDNWGSNSFRTFVLLNDYSTENEVEYKIFDAIRDNNENSTTDVFLQPLTDIHLYSSFYGRSGPGDVIYIYIVSIIAIFVLLIASINFMNLSTARSANRAKEIGMRKVAGALRSNIIKQFFGESIILSLISLILALLIVAIILPAFNGFVEKPLSMNIVSNFSLLAGILVITVFTGIIAGSYPALYLSSFKPVTVLRGTLTSGVKSSSFRKVMVTIQFTLSIILIISTLAVYSQLDYISNKKLGWDRDHLIYINMRGDIGDSYDVIRNELIKDSSIIDVTQCQFIPTSFGSNSSSVDWDGKDPEETLLVRHNYVDYDYIKTIKANLLEGRAFSRDFATDTSGAYIINETMANFIGKEQIIGANFSMHGRPGKIIGVLEDFHFLSMKSEIEPMCLVLRKRYLSYIMIRISPENITSTIEHIEDSWSRVYSNYPLDYRFINEDFDSMYRGEVKMGRLFKYFSSLAVFISCLGLFGLASFTAEQRTKEIGIRKVLGSSSQNIVLLLSKEFVKLVLLANIIAWPVAYFAADSWLENFAYRTDVGYSIFIYSGVAALIIAILTVSYQAIKAAFSNPVDALKYE
ncbi:MAG: FtsX-like permease family protein [bacterium]|nr:FtsX-like permease family protein [bacterium]